MDFKIFESLKSLLRKWIDKPQTRKNIFLLYVYLTKSLLSRPNENPIKLAIQQALKNLDENSIYKRSNSISITIEEEIINKSSFEELKKAIKQLPEVQQRRIKKY